MKKKTLEDIETLKEKSIWKNYWRQQISFWIMDDTLKYIDEMKWSENVILR